ncbi:VanZ family protein [bacterium]|nr:VanZ family protein [candidate division CSSED10-310 bacterium]
MNFRTSVLSSRFRFFLSLPMLLQMAVMLAMASEGRPAMTLLFPDAALHVIAYIILGVLAWIAWLGIAPETPPRRLYLYSAVTAILFGALDESTQLFSPARTAQLDDWIADIAGTLISLILIAAGRRIIHHWTGRTARRISS